MRIIGEFKEIVIIVILLDLYSFVSDYHCSVHFECIYMTNVWLLVCVHVGDVL